MDSYILQRVLVLTNNGKDYKNFCLVSKAWCNMLNRLFPGGDKFCNHLLTLLKLLPDERWDYNTLSSNPNILEYDTLDYILQNSDKGWDWREISTHDYVTWETMQNHTNIPWAKNNFCYNKNISKLDLEFIKQNFVTQIWKYRVFMYKNISIEDIKKEHDLINYFTLSQNKNYTWEIIQNNPDIPWDYDGVQRNRNITLDNIYDNPDKPWNYDMLYIGYRFLNADNEFKTTNRVAYLSINECIEKFPDMIDYKKLSYKYGTTWNLVKKYIDKPWNFKGLSCNDSIIVPLDDFIKYSKLWNYKFISSHVTWDCVAALPDKRWDYGKLSGNLHIPLEIIFTTDKPWNYDEVSVRSDLTWRIIMDNLDKPWDFRELSYCLFNKK